MNAAIDYNSVIWEQQNGINESFKKIEFFLSNNLIAKIFRNFGAINLVKKQVKEIDVKLLERSLIFSALVPILKDSFESYKGTDLSKEINYLQLNINHLTKALEMGSAFTEQYGTKHIDFSNTIFFLEKLIESYYDILRIYKRANKKTRTEPSELAKQTADYSLNNLGRVLNASR